MHRRNGTWVEGHYRNGSWVEGHWRSSTYVNDSSYVQAYIQPQQKIASYIHASLLYGSVTFLTECWWCGVSVYFHRDENGGCVLFDELGKPWPVHPCWEENKYEQGTAINQALVNQSKIITSHVQPKVVQYSKRVEGLIISGLIVSHAQTKEIKIKDGGMGYKLIDLLVLSGDKYYQVLVDEKYKNSLLSISMAKFKCSVRKRGLSYIMYSQEVYNYLPGNEELIFSSPLKVEKLTSLPWVYTKLKNA